MKILKISYYVFVSLCLIQLLAYLLAPYGGTMSILNSIKKGLYVVTINTTGGYKVISLDFPPYNTNPYIKFIQIFNSLLAALYFSALMFCCLTLFFYKRNIKNRYKAGIISGIMAFLIFLFGGMVWRYVVKLCLGV